MNEPKFPRAVPAVEGETKTPEPLVESHTPVAPEDCPDDETLAAFIDGGLSAVERARVEAHLSECEDCYEAMLETATLRAEMTPVQPTPFWRRPEARYGLLAIAATVAGVLLIRPAWLSPGSSDRPELTELVAAVGAQRPTEGRLTGLAWGPPPAVTRSAAPSTTSDPALDIAVAHLDQALRQNRTPLNLSAFGVGAIAKGRLDDGIRALEEAAAVEPRPATWSDLSAGYLARGKQLDHAVDLPRALDAAKHALSLDPRSQEAQFNLALTLEALNLRQEALNAWTTYLSLDDTSAWADEAKRHVAELRKTSTTSDQTPQPVRERLFDRVLVDWSNANDAASVTAAWAEAQQLAKALDAANADRLAADTVAAIAGADAGHRDRLRDGHRAYGIGRDLYRQTRYAEARSQFVSAATSLGAGGSPLRFFARFWEAAAQHLSGDAAGARLRLEQLLSDLRPYPYRAVRGRVAAALGLVNVVLGNHGAAASHYAMAEAELQDAGEVENRAFVQQLMAENLNTLGNQAQSWNVRIPALAVSTRNASLLSAAQAARQTGWLTVAGAFLDEAVDRARAARQTTELVDSLRARAIVSARAGDYAAAKAQIQEARRFAAPLPNLERLTAEIDAAEVQATDVRSAAAGIMVGTRALDYFSRAHQTHRLPALYLARARLHRTLEQDADAERDLLAGLEVLEQERETITRRDLRATFGEDLGRLTDDLVALKLDHQRTAEAFDTLERTRSADLLRQSTEVRQTASQAELEAFVRPGQVIAYFYATEQKLLIWVVQAGKTTLVESPVGAQELTRLVARFSADPASDVRRRLRELVVDPIEPLMANDDLLAAVPDGPLSLLSFAGLPGRRTPYLIEEHAVVVAPSATWMIQASRRSQRLTGHPTQITAIGDPRINRSRFPDLPALPAAGDEAAAVSAHYASPVVLTHEAATRDAILRLLPTTEVLHFAGHAVVNDVRPLDSQLVVWSPDGNGLTAADLAAMRLPRMRLVVLAACSSASGLLTRSEGPLGFSRAILAAGVPAVVASYWLVNDRASYELFVRFHEAYAQSGDPVTALRAAQMAMVHSKDAAMQMPAAWAGFVSIGGPALTRD